MGNQSDSIHQKQVFIVI